MDFVKGIKIKKRMCNTFKTCNECPLGYNKDGIKDAVIDCDEFILRHPQKTIEILEEWDKEHPQKLRKDDFFEKLPNAPKADNNTPQVCAEHCGYCKCKVSFDFIPEDCISCWNTPLDESDGD